MKKRIRRKILRQLKLVNAQLKLMAVSAHKTGKTEIFHGVTLQVIMQAYKLNAKLKRYS